MRNGPGPRHARASRPSLASDRALGSAPLTRGVRSTTAGGRSLLAGRRVERPGPGGVRALSGDRTTGQPSPERREPARLAGALPGPAPSGVPLDERVALVGAVQPPERERRQTGIERDTPAVVHVHGGLLL